MGEDRSITLSQLLACGSHAAVRFVCLGCGSSLDVPAGQAIGHLEKTGVGDADTLVVDVGALAERPCHSCRGTRWRTRAVGFERVGEGPAIDPGAVSSSGADAR